MSRLAYNLASVIAIFSATTQAHEIKEGTLEYSGGTSGGLGSSDSSYTYNNGLVSSYDSTDTSVSVTSNYYLLRNFALGINVGYDSTHEKFTRTLYNVPKENITTDSTSYSLGPTLTYHYPLTSTLNLVLNGRIAIRKTETKRTGNSDFSSSGNAVRGGLGLTYFLSESISIYTTIFYSSQNLHGKFQSGVTSEYKQSGLNAGLGFSLYIL